MNPNDNEGRMHRDTQPAGARPLSDSLTMQADVASSSHAIYRTTTRFAIMPSITWVASYYSATWAWMALNGGGVYASTPWSPNALLLAALLLSPPSRWWLPSLAIIPAHLLAPMPGSVWQQLWQLGHCAILAWGIAGAVRLCIRTAYPFGTLRHLVTYLCCVVVLTPIALAMFAIQVAWSPLAPDVPFAWRSMLLVSATDFVILTPAIVIWTRKGGDWLRTGHALQCTAASLLAIGIGIVSMLTLSSAQQWACLYLLGIVVVYTAIKLGIGGTTVALSLVVLASTCFAAVDGWVFSAGKLAMQQLHSLQIVVIAFAFPAVTLAAWTHDRSRSTEALLERAAQWRQSWRRLSRSLRQSRTLLRRSDKRTRLILRVTNDVIFEWNMVADSLWWSDNGVRFFDRRVAASPATMERWSRRIHQGDRDRVRAELQGAIDHGERLWESEHRLVERDGTIVHVHVRGLILSNSAGLPVRMIGSLVDITDRRQLQEATRMLARGARLAMVGELTAAITHEINQPLGAILNNAETALFLLDCGAKSLNDIRAILADIRDDDLRASTVVRRIRALLQDRELQRQRLDLNKRVTDAVSLLRAQARRRRITMEVAHGEIPLVEADPAYLQQLLLNLIANGMDALEHAPEAMRRIEIATAAVPRGMVEVRISDSGCGLRQEQLPRIFESFYTTKSDGMGLGLSIARSIVAAHGGRISAENNIPGPGATFRFQLPAAGICTA